jgi:mannose-6-phosphate isomerase-like protein (cupin superfamily)
MVDGCRAATVQLEQLSVDNHHRRVVMVDFIVFSGRGTTLCRGKKKEIKRENGKEG